MHVCVYMYVYPSEARHTAWNAGTCSKHVAGCGTETRLPTDVFRQCNKVCGCVVLQEETQQLLFKDSLLEWGYLPCDQHILFSSVAISN